MVRKLVTRSTHRVVGYHVSRKSAEAVPWESQNEEAYFQWLEVDPEVISFKSQPHTFQWDDFRYTPDALVETYKGSFFAEVKEDQALDDEKVSRRLEEVQSRLANEGVDFRIVLKSEIFSEPLRSNIKNIYRHARSELQANDWKQLSRFEGEWPALLKDLESDLGDWARRLILKFVSWGELSVDLTKEIGPSTIVSIPTWKESRYASL